MAQQKQQRPLPPGLAIFLAALRWQESGSPAGNYREPNGQGAYQIVQGNWPAWAKQYAGYTTTDPNASDAPKSVQDEVAAGKVADYYYGAGEKNWRLVARIWNGGSPNPVPNPALGPGATTDTYATAVLNKVSNLTDNGYGPTAEKDILNNVGSNLLGTDPESQFKSAPCQHDLKVAIPAFPDLHLCMDKPIAVLAFWGGGTLILAGITLIAIAAFKNTSTGRQAVKAAAVVPGVGRVATKVARAPKARATAKRVAGEKEQAATARRQAPVHAERRREERHRQVSTAREERLSAARVRNAQNRSAGRQRLQQRQETHDQRMQHRDSARLASNQRRRYPDAHRAQTRERRESGTVTA